MTLAQERRYISKINEAKEAQKEWSRRNDSGEFDSMDDESWENEMKTAVHAVYLAKMAYFDAKLKTIRANDWYKSFLRSFGFPSDSPEDITVKKVSEKQALKLMEKGEFHRDANAYYFRYDAIVYCVEPLKYSGYRLTIRRQYC